MFRLKIFQPDLQKNVSVAAKFQTIPEQSVCLPDRSYGNSRHHRLQALWKFDQPTQHIKQLLIGIWLFSITHFFPFFLFILRGIARVFVSFQHDFHARKHILVDNTFVVFLFLKIYPPHFHGLFFFHSFSSFDSFYFYDIFSMALLERGKDVFLQIKTGPCGDRW